MASRLHQNLAGKLEGSMTNRVNNNPSQPANSQQDIWNYLYGPDGILHNVPLPPAEGAEGDSPPAEYSQILGEEFFALYSQVSKAAAQGEIPPPADYLHSEEELETFPGNKSGLDYDLKAILDGKRVMGIVESLGEFSQLKAIINSKGLSGRGVILAFAVMYLSNKDKVEKLFRIAGDLEPSSMDGAIVMAKLTEGVRNMSRDLTAGTNSLKALDNSRKNTIDKMSR